MEIAQLTTFVAVAEQLSFIRAAERLHVVQPAVSQQIKRLESDLGVALLARTSRRVALTEAGRRLLPEARAVLAAAERARAAATGFADEAERKLTLGTSTGLGAPLHHVLAALRERGIDVRLVHRSLTKRLDAVRAGAVQAAFVQSLVEAPGLTVLPAWDEPLIAALAADHPLAAADEVELTDLADVPARLSRPRSNPPFRAQVVSAFADRGLRARLGPVFTNLQDVLAEVAGREPCWVPLYGDLPAVPGVAYRPVAGVRVTTALVTRPDPPGPALRALIDAIASLVVD